jgi:hypothetical protein
VQQPNSPVQQVNTMRGPIDASNLADEQIDTMLVDNPRKIFEGQAVLSVVHFPKCAFPGSTGGLRACPSPSGRTPRVRPTRRQLDAAEPTGNETKQVSM